MKIEITREEILGFEVTMDKIYKNMAESHPKLRRGTVWCKKCGNEVSVNASDCLKTGWPKCCDETMTIDSPTDRQKQEATNEFN